MTVIFFDIGDTLATPRLDANRQLLELTVLPGVLSALEALSKRQLRMGIISNRGNLEAAAIKRALDVSRLLDFFEPGLIIFAKKDSSIPFQKAAETAGVDPRDCIFVGENNQERAHALSAGYMKAIPDPALVIDVLDGSALLFASLSGGKTNKNAWSNAFKDPALVPLRVANNRRDVQVLTTTSALERLRKSRLKIELLGKEDTPQLSDLYLIRDDRSVPEDFLSAQAFSTQYIADAGWQDLIVDSTDGGLFVALPAGLPIEQLHFPDALHGHNERLIPDRSLLTSLTGTTARLSTPVATASLAPALSNEELEALRGITAASIRQLHERYTGAAPLASSENPIVSRHIKHADNKRATDALVRHFEEVGAEGIVVRRRPFKYQELALENVEAELPGEVPGSFILITAHLDSTAIASSGGFNAASDPAPGSDDDASGVAGVLAAAQVLASLARIKKTRRSIRFVLFNAEEQGLVGSKSYARAQAAQQVEIAAVFQMDMIGFRRQQTQPARNFEIHAGFTAEPDVEERSLALAQLVHETVSRVSPNLNPPQIYPNVLGGIDPAAGRSDHAAFQQRGYAACIVCEDFFVGPAPDSPPAAPNPNYHRNTDVQIDYEYAADIARVVTGAALIAAS